MTTVLIVDDEDLVRDGLIAIVSSHPDIDVVGTAANGNEAIERARQLCPEVVLMDLRMPGTGGIDATATICRDVPSTRVLVLTTMETEEVVASALRAGASGFLLKSVPREQLWWGIQAVASGDALLAPAITRRMIETHLLPPKSDRPAISGTQRQLEVARLVAEGLSNKEISERLFLAETTVKTHVSDLLANHHLRDRTQLVVLAYESGLVRPGE